MSVIGVPCSMVPEKSTDVRDDTAIGVEQGIEHERAENVIIEFLRRWNARDDRFENVLDADARLGAGENRFFARNGKNVFELFLAHLGIRTGQIDLVDDRG